MRRQKAVSSVQNEYYKNSIYHTIINDVFACFYRLIIPVSYTFGVHGKLLEGRLERTVLAQVFRRNIHWLGLSSLAAKKRLL